MEETERERRRKGLRGGKQVEGDGDDVSVWEF